MSWVVALQAVAACPAADLPSRIGGGNVGLSLERAESKFKTLNAIGAGMCRVPVHPRLYGLVDGKPHPKAMDDLIWLCHRRGVEPLLLFEYYTKWGIPLGGSDEWREIGEAFAKRFAPGSKWLVARGVRDWGVRYYSAFNEPAQRRHNPTPLPPRDYAAALEGLADGVHAVDVSLKVSPGGWSETPLRYNKHRYPEVVAPLFNAGKLHAICIHRYWDVQHVPMARRYDWSLQSQFDDVKRRAGITADVAFATDEINIKLRRLSEPEAAKQLLTALWDALGVVGHDGRPVAEFVMPWNLFHASSSDEQFGLSHDRSSWEPTERGRVVSLVCRLTSGMDFVFSDPRRRGLYVLEGNGAKLWVWQNRHAWTDTPGDRMRLVDLPSYTEEIDVFGWEGLRRSVSVAGKKEVVVDQLTVGETYMFKTR